MVITHFFKPLDIIHTDTYILTYNVYTRIHTCIHAYMFIFANIEVMLCVEHLKNIEKYKGNREFFIIT